MKEQITSKEWILLSSYLDGELNLAEKAQVENLIQARSEIASAYQSLKQTRAVLRAAPRKRVPHNFTLTPDMLPQPFRIPRIVPVLRFSSLVAALVAVFLFVNQLVPGLAPAMAPATALKSPDQSFSAMEAQDTQAPLAAGIAPTESNAENLPPVVYWGGPPAASVPGMGGGGSGGGGDSGSPCLSGCGGYEGGLETNPDTRSFIVPPTEVPAEPQATAEASILSMAPAESQTGDNPILGVAPQEAQGKELSDTYTSALPAISSAAPTASNPARSIPFLLYTAIGLAILAAGSLVASMVIYQNAKR